MPDHAPIPLPPPGLRERRKQVTRHALELAALRLFARDGFAETTVEAIAAEAGVSTRTFFRYFATKEDVLNPLREIRQGMLREELLAVPEDAGDLLSVAVAGLCRMAPDFEGEGDVVRLWAQAAYSSALLRGRLYEVLLSWEDKIRRALAERAGVAADAPEVVAAAAAAVALWQHAVERWQADLESDQPEHDLAGHLRALHAALRP
ncbi:TetR family transcriptional regulator [Nocardioides sp. GY 10113]|uniref:TetR/AcrR family transcriptional regulator n=1 Tax=Nocardioides sp. GY 10113 TaxID=2569761 RepID=UPI0010A76496|nr:TetR/AcrR family transcriptional regulator [Nocardioides sp. GY 10113]TIC87493.1 TetR family transcriptional regulator [Nocardioides sp. GY 10113]